MFEELEKKAKEADKTKPIPFKINGIEFNFLNVYEDKVNLSSKSFNFFPFSKDLFSLFIDLSFPFFPFLSPPPKLTFLNGETG